MTHAQHTHGMPSDRETYRQVTDANFKDAPRHCPCALPAKTRPPAISKNPKLKSIDL